MPADTAQPYWTTSVSDITPEDVFVRGYPIQSLIGRLPFPAVAALLMRGRMPTPGEARMLDAILCSILDYALQKSGTVAARCVVSVNPQMVPGLAAGILAAGEHALSPENTGRFVIETAAAWKRDGGGMDAFADKLVADLRRDRKRVPGFGHPVFKGVDPRAERLKAIALEVGVWGEMNDLYEAVHRAFRTAAGKPDLVMNDVGMIAALLAQMGYSPQEMAGIALLSTLPGLIAHVSEELAANVKGRVVPDSIAGFARDRRDLSADMREAGWEG